MTRSLLALTLIAAAAISCAPGDSETADRSDDPLVADVVAPAPTAAAAAAPAATAASFACTPPHETPVYTRPPTDGVALETLIEGAAYLSPADSDWRDATAGNFCSDASKELMLLRAADFSVLGGPTPNLRARSAFLSDASHPWRAVAAGNLDADAYDEIVALRNVSAAGVSDVVVTKVNPRTCAVDTLLAQRTIGGVGANWLDVAIGNFDGTGKKLAMLKATTPAFTLAQVSAGALNVTFASDLDTNASYPWKAIGAGDLDGDGIDELIAARQVGDGRGTTVNAYKWNGSGFARVAASTFGNTGNSGWASMAVADFNGDGRRAIGLVKNAHSYFSVLDLPAGASSLRVVATSDLDSASGQTWRGLAATDWSAGDQGAAELIAVRAAQSPYRDDVFVYGSSFHRVARESGLADTRAQWDQIRGTPSAQLAGWLAGAHTTTMNWHLGTHGDYTALVDFLEYTKSTCVDGRQLRVWLTVTAPANINPANPDDCQFPEDSPLTPWNELAFFAADNGDGIAQCRDYPAWSSIIGLLAKQYPHLVAFTIDDYMHHPDGIPGETLALMQSRLRAQAPWMNFIVETYYGDMSTSTVPDFARMIDTYAFYFRNEKHGQCLSGSCGEASVWYAPEEISYVAGFLPAGRKLQVGTYWGTLWSTPPQRPSTRYDYDLGRMVLNLPNLGGLTAYPMQAPTIACDEYDFLHDGALDNPPQDDNHAKYCTVQRVFGEAQHPVTHTDLTSASGAPLAAGDPFGYEYASHGVQNVVYRATDDHAHELWRAGSSIGHSDLTALAGAPAVLGDVKGYVFPQVDMQNVVYRGTDWNVHVLWWNVGAVGHDNVTALAGAPLAAGTPYPYVFDAVGMQNVLYRGTDGHVHGLWWNTGAVGHDDLTSLSRATGPAGDPFGYTFDAYGVQNALYRGTDGRLHDLWWSTGAVAHDDLTALSGAPGPASDARAYIAPAYGIQNAIYRGGDGHVHGLYWSTGAVGHDDLTNATHAPAPVGNPTGYFLARDATHHVVYRSNDNHVHALSWTVGAVADDDLTLLGAAPLAAGDPAPYVLSTDGSEHVIYRSSDGHVHELTFR